MKRFGLFIMVFSLCIALTSCTPAETSKVSVGYNQSLINVCDMGAIPNDGKDDTLAFKITVNAGDSIYVPPGVYEISESLYVRANVLIGAGTDKTVIVANIKKVRDPIIWAGDRTQIRDITIKFADNCITGTEIAGERCGIVTTAKGDRNLCRGGAITNVKIQNVGTGVYSTEGGIFTESKGNGTAFSATFDSIFVIDFSYRGIDMQSDHRTGNVYRNLYLSSGKYKANMAFALGQAESESSVAELTVADSKLKVAVNFNTIHGANVTNINIINTELTEDNTAFVYADESMVAINSLVFNNSVPKGDKQAFIRVGEGAYRGSLDFNKGGYLKVNNMSIFNEKVTDSPNSNQFMLSRDNAYIHGYDVIIENFKVKAPAELKTQYEKFKFDNRGLNLTVNGKNLTEEAQ